MDCPYCHKEMLLGYIPVYKGALEWIPFNQRGSSFIWGSAKDGVKITRIAVMTVPQKEAFACKDCHLILMTYEDFKK